MDENAESGYAACEVAANAVENYPIESRYPPVAETDQQNGSGDQNDQKQGYDSHDVDHSIVWRDFPRTTLLF
jgi:hypothetical protein